MHQAEAEMRMLQTDLLVLQQQHLSQMTHKTKEKTVLEAAVQAHVAETAQLESKINMQRCELQTSGEEHLSLLPRSCSEQLLRRWQSLDLS